MSDLNQLAFEISHAQLRSQKDDLRHARGHSAIVATVTGLIATVFASLVDFENLISQDTLYFAGIPLELLFVLVTFLPSIYFASLVSIDHRTCTFDLSPTWIIKQKDGGKSYEEVRLHLTEDCDRYFDENERAIKDAQANMRYAVLFGFAQIPAWILILV